MLKKVEETVHYIQTQYNQKPQVGIVLGSGLGSFVKEVEVEKVIPYKDIPHFPQSTVEGHSGELIFGKMGGKTVAVMAGRFHFYEGYSAKEVVFPIYVLRYLGIEYLLLSNAAGAMNASYQVGDLMVITDHISQFIANPLIGKNDARMGPRFPDMSEPYNKTLIQKVDAIAATAKIPLHHGVYVAVTGPTFETRAEYKMLKVLGADVVGMSTVQEVIAAVYVGLPVFAMSVVTDIGIREEENTITHAEVLEAAHGAEPKLTYIYKNLIESL